MGKLDDYKKDNGIEDGFDFNEEEIEFDEDDINIEQIIQERESNKKTVSIGNETSTNQTMEEVEEKILSVILNKGQVPDTINEHVFSSLTYKTVFLGVKHFSDQDENNEFDAEAVGHLLTKRHQNNKWKDEVVPNIMKKTEGKDVKVENYLSILKEQNIGIKATEIANNIQDHIRKGDLDYLKLAAAELNGIELFEDSGYDTLQEALNSAMFNLDEKINSDSEHSGIPTGIPTLDDTTGGLQKSDLIILAARPGQGKTATAINFAYNGNVPCGFVSSEMPSEQLALRLLSLDSGVNAQKIRNPKKLLPDELAALRASAKKLAEEKEIYIDDKPNISIQEVREKVKVWKEKYDIQVLYIDYIQRLTYKAPGSDSMPRHERIGMVAMESKEIAREFHIAVVGLAQISRGAEKNDGTGGRPMLSDLKDSGMIEQEADLVICPFRENMSGMDVNAVTEMEILLLKNRHGPLGEIDAIWIPKNMKIVEVDDDGSQMETVETEEEEEDIPY